ncbi:riboflavin synthase [Verrucomicrobiales bacterium]|nr:riboflavin synthase [Verrucomicrobiales bacterium]
MFDMFTGIIEEAGEIAAVESIENGARLQIRASFVDELAIGESVATNGACLTVTKVENGAASFDLLHETLRVTNLGDLEVGSVVNLERSLAIGDRLSGHFVQGHVDRTCEIIAFEKVGNDHRLEIELPSSFAHLVVHKGSICIDGMSLTVAELGEKSVTIWIIPHTLLVTNLKNAAAGKRVNVEFDLLAKHISRMATVKG